MRSTKANLSRRAALAGLATLPCAARAAILAERPPKLGTPVKLTIGVARASHLAPLVDMQKTLAELGVEAAMPEFARYADSRTALASGSVEIACMAPADLPLLLSQGISGVVGLMGVASSAKNPILRNGIACDTWEDLMKLQLGVPPGGAVWYQFIAKIQELGYKYNQFKTVNIQGAGTNFAQALQRGEIDAYINAEPADSLPQVGGFGGPAVKLDYSQSKAVGAELGLIAASGAVLDNKPEAVRRFLWAYFSAEAAMAADQAVYAQAIQRWSGLDAGISRVIAGKIRLGSVLDTPQLVRLSAFMKENGLLQRDVASELPSHYDPPLVRAVLHG